MDSKKGSVVRPHLNIGGGAGFKIDVMLLTDSTGSMVTAINDVKANFVSAYNALLSSTSWDAQVGVAYYKDLKKDPDAFKVVQQITNNTTLLSTAVNSLVAKGGGDTPEDQLYALTQLASRKTSGWRAGATRVICWFGDQPGHDPITVGGVTYTLSSTCEALIDRNVFVCAFSMAPDNNLNGNQGGSANQATTIANMTNGVTDGSYCMSNVQQSGVTQFIFNFLTKHTP